MNRDDTTGGGDGSETTTLEGAFEPNVMGAYDKVGDQDAFVIAAIDAEEAWIAVPAGAEFDVEDWH
jgi:hypothetical protein